MSSAPTPGDRDDDPAARRATGRGRARLIIGLAVLAVVVVVLLVWLILFQSADEASDVDQNGSPAPVATQTLGAPAG